MRGLAGGCLPVGHSCTMSKHSVEVVSFHRISILFLRSPEAFVLCRVRSPLGPCFGALGYQSRAHAFNRGLHLELVDCSS